MAVVAPEAIGRYQLDRRIARGGMGEIYLASDLALQRRVVIKRLHPELARDDHCVDSFLHEGRAIAQVRHPNVILVHDVGVDGDEDYYLVLEWLSGCNLRHIENVTAAKGEKVPPRIVLALVHAAALGLHAAHTAIGGDGQPLAIVHQDVSPHNLFVTREGITKVLDFGIAASTRYDPRAGSRLGKPSYMSPEQVAGGSIDARTDVFALGVVCYELLAGERLFLRPSVEETLDAVLHQPILPPGDGLGLPEAVLRCLREALQRDPDLRYATAAALANDIEAAAHDLGGLAEPSEICSFIEQLLPTHTAPLDVEETDRLGDALTLLIAGPTGGVGVDELPTIELTQAPATSGATERLSAKDGEKPGRPSRGPLLAFALTLSVAAAAWWLWPANHGTNIPASVESAPASAVPTNKQQRTSAESSDPALPDVQQQASAEPSTPVPEKTSRRARRRASRARDKRAVATPAWGRISIDSVPWARVSVNGKPLGPTPIIEYRVRAGVVTVRLVNAELGLSAHETVTVPADANIRRRFTLK